MAKRSYRQQCALAHTLDLVGERWTLLIIREMLTGPKRFTDLQHNLPGIGTNLLAVRLRELEDTKVVQRGTLPPPAASSIYELTSDGRRLENAIVELAGWGLRSIDVPVHGDHRRSPWSLLALRALAFEMAPANLIARIEFRVNGEVFHGRIGKAKLSVEQGASWEEPDLVVTVDSDTLILIVTGRLHVTEAISSGAFRIEGQVRLKDLFVGVMKR